MISYHRFVDLLNNLFCCPIFLNSLGFRPSFSTDYKNFFILFEHDFLNNSNGSCTWWHEEPLYEHDLNNLQWRTIKPEIGAGSVFGHDLTLSPLVPGITDNTHDINFNIFANSEKSKLKKIWINNAGYFDWYFFFHGFAALDWFRDFHYFDSSNVKISKLFICINHLISKKRSYRLSLISHLKEKNLIDYGFVSAPLLDKKSIKNELYSKDSLISMYNKKHIFEHLLPTASPMILDTCNSYNFSSADIIDFKYSHGALWHLVTETVFYDEKLHLTEKIFKPIAVKRPFILVGAARNLEYLKSYGFKTFDRWIDESYDLEFDPDRRIQKIILELEKLKNQDLNKMHLEMQEVLEFNHQHFYRNFKEIIIDEMIDNFKKCVFLFNKDLTGRFRLPEENLDYNKIKNILMRG